MNTQIESMKRHLHRNIKNTINNFLHLYKKGYLDDEKFLDAATHYILETSREIYTQMQHIKEIENGG